MNELTTLIASVQAGDSTALDQIFTILYPELKDIARARMRSSRRLTMLDTTLLVHECFIRFQRLGQLSLNDRHHFLAYAARVIRTVIVDIVRREQSDKRGGADGSVTLDTASSEGLIDDRSNVLEVAEALDSLAAIDPRMASIVEMRFFAGFSDSEIAQILDIGERTVRRDWEKARAFLMVELRR
ncbi:MAG: sigma-70 family RNA polymerase sigma factor [Burkholderiales bacterium]|nr:sigma-70 family RNA polymerase sigma factor [Burkholderiales bacterium]MDE1926233.1 sigma-70 family RNA polymerase sigma factor [Burkholderiales bacterium]MDE2159242.1 sigma-70 family RNA polymerase sigma factor [Burkholderiales bacterium]MDE2501613.1 sigma-70 family RNA polymerase sigma factor [Burkholderiales bacterium]